MSHRSLEQLQQLEASLKERLKAVRAEIKERESTAITRLAKSYAKTLHAAMVAGEGELPTPEELAALLAAKPAAKKPRSRKPKAAA